MRVNTGPRGFTLVEMLVVMAVVGILAATLSAVLIKVRHTSAQVACGENMRQVGTTLNAIMLANGGVYPTLYRWTDTSTDPDTVTIPTVFGGADDWDGENGTPWWALIYAEWQGSVNLDTNFDASEPDKIELPDQLPAAMKSFQCRMAPPLAQPVQTNSNAANMRALDRSISYGLNYDVAMADGTLYNCVDESDANYPDLDASAAPGAATQAETDANLAPDAIVFSRIRRPAEFILLAEAYVENGTGGRIRSAATTNVTNASDPDGARVVGRHGGKSNAYFGDGHVEAVAAPTLDNWATGTTDYMPWSQDINKNTPLWTLPND